MATDWRVEWEAVSEEVKGIRFNQIMSVVDCYTKNFWELEEDICSTDFIKEILREEVKYGKMGQGCFMDSSVVVSSYGI